MKCPPLENKKMRLCQNADTAFFMRKAQTFSSPGFVITQSFRIFRYTSNPQLSP